ncbi:hypothetical protein HK098_001604 [Nowakowskiella sp. JEL0407]|nr:hypothetical protein HK098_001604 [Nowakowskiella sp. JEL0407]
MLDAAGEDWKFEMRREMQEIIPGLYCGPVQSAKNKEKLIQNQITHILCIRDRLEAKFVKPQFPGEFQYDVIEVSESPLQNLISYFPQAFSFIDHALKSGGKILVHCNSGVSRSPAFVVAYIMETRKWSYEQAFSLVQGKRFCMNPHESFKSQLQEYYAIYGARAQINLLQYSPQQILQQGGRRRRAPEEEDEEASEMMASFSVGHKTPSN